MQNTTGFSLAGQRITKELGTVRGLVVRSRSVIGNIGAGLQTIFGGDITLSTPVIPLRAITIQGSYVGSLGELQELLELVRQKGLPALPVATRPLTSAGAALDDLRAGNVIGRLVLTP